MSGSVALAGRPRIPGANEPTPPRLACGRGVEAVQLRHGGDQVRRRGRADGLDVLAGDADQVRADRRDAPDAGSR